MNPEQHSFYDYAKDFWIPTVLGLGAIVSGLWGKPGVLLLGLAVATAAGIHRGLGSTAKKSQGTNTL